ncbi:MAG: HAMP domain-containing sensor histidine kinase [bacterium]|nr:HAMP domain-containing sensor histidine kinase [bacterium]
MHPEKNFRVVALYAISAAVYGLVISLLFAPLTAGEVFIHILIFLLLTKPLAFFLYRESRTQHTLAERNRQLEAVISERTNALTIAQEEQQQLSRMKARFITDVIHSLRTPITSINMRLEMLENVPPEDYPKQVNGLKRQIEQMNALIVDVLDLVYLEEQGTPVTSEPVDLNTLIQQIVEAHHDLAETNHITLDFCPADSLPPVLAGRNHLGQLISNLMTNAIKYTAKGGVKVITAFDPARDMVRVDVKDTGMGIDPEDLPKLFDRFFRSKRATRSGVAGTGLGLGIVREILDLYGGDIDVQSKVGEGSTFSLWLPVQRAVPPSAPSATTSDTKPPSKPRQSA